MGNAKSRARSGLGVLEWGWVDGERKKEMSGVRWVTRATVGDTKNYNMQPLPPRSL